MPVKTGIQTTLKHWIPGRATPDSDPGLPGMTTEFCCEFLTQDTSFELSPVLITLGKTVAGLLILTSVLAVLRETSRF